jgi:hypothetical protein
MPENRRKKCDFAGLPVVSDYIHGIVLGEKHAGLADGFIDYGAGLRRRGDGVGAGGRRQWRV